MVKIIETNLLIQNGEIIDHQSRVIEVESWEDFINEIKNSKTIIRNSCLGNSPGCIIPKQSRIENLIYDDIRLSCDIYNYEGVKTKKLAYLIK